MPSFARQSHQAPFTLQSPCHAETGAGTKNCNGALVLVAPLKDHLLISIEVGQPVNQHAEIIHQFEPLRARSLRQVGFPQSPGKVGDPGLALPHRTGNGDAGMRWGWEISGTVVEEGLEHRLKRCPFP